MVCYHISGNIGAAETRGMIETPDSWRTPESRYIGSASTADTASIDFKGKTHSLLFIAGSADQIIPASLNLTNFEKYEGANSLTEFKRF